MTRPCAGPESRRSTCRWSAWSSKRCRSCTATAPKRRRASRRTSLWPSPRPALLAWRSTTCLSRWDSQKKSQGKRDEGTGAGMREFLPSLSRVPAPVLTAFPLGLLSEAHLVSPDGTHRGPLEGARRRGLERGQREYIPSLSRVTAPAPSTICCHVSTVREPCNRLCSSRLYYNH